MTTDNAALRYAAKIAVETQESKGWTFPPNAVARIGVALMHSVEDGIALAEVLGRRFSRWDGSIG